VIGDNFHDTWVLHIFGGAYAKVKVMLVKFMWKTIDQNFRIELERFATFKQI
jgi:hypothetical protein